MITFKLINKVFSIWVMYFLLAILISILPHLEVHFLSWFNYSLYFLLAIISFFISRKDKYLGDVHLNFALTFLFYSLFILSLLVGKNYLIGNNFLMYYLFVYRKIILGTLLSFSVLYLVLRYVLPNWPRWLSYLFAISLVLSLVLIQLKDFIINKKFIFQVGPTELYRDLLPLYILPFLALLLYGYIIFRYDRPNGMFVGSFAMALFILLSLAISDLFAAVGYIKRYGVDQYFLAVCLIVMAIILTLRLAILHSEVYLLKERFIFDSSLTTNMSVITHDTETTYILKLLKSAITNQYILIAY